MYVTKNKSGFTLLEIIIVIIIVGVLASLALPQFTSVIERSRGGEALNNLSALRGAMVRCGFVNNGVYTTCAMGSLDVAQPGTAANASFTYTVAGSGGSFTVTATRNTANNGDGTSTVFITQNDTAATVTKGGTGVFLGI